MPVAAIAPDPDQPRRSIAGTGLELLAASLRAHGVLQPLLVSPHPEPAVRSVTPFQIIAGGRRWAAAQLAGLETVPVFVRTEPISPSDRLMVQLDENDGELRRGLTLYDRACAVARAVALSGLGKLEFAQRHQKSPAWCSHYLKLAAATGPLAEALREGHLTGFLTATLYGRLAEAQQLRLLAAARRTSTPITAQQIEVAAARGGQLAAELAGLAGAAGEPDGPAAADRPRWTVRLTVPQLDDLLVRLGQRPRGTPGDRVEQLYACLS